MRKNDEMKKAAEEFFISLAVYVAGALIGSLIVSMIMFIGWENKEKILISGYAALGTVTVWFWKYMERKKGREIEALEHKIDLLEKKLESKADADDVKNITSNILRVENKVDKVMTFLMENTK